MKASATQIGGNHYKSFPIQPYEFFIKNNLPFHKADIIKRIMRYDLPTGGGVKDLRKIVHEVALILEYQYPREKISIDVRNSSTIAHKHKSIKTHKHKSTRAHKHIRTKTPDAKSSKQIYLLSIYNTAKMVKMARRVKTWFLKQRAKNWGSLNN